MNNYFENMLNMQKSMMDSWKDVFSKQGKEGNNYLNFAAYFDNMAKMSEQMNNMFYKTPGNYKDMFKMSFPYANEYAKNIYKMNEAMFKNPVEIWDNLNENANFYFKAYELYKNLMEDKAIRENNISQFLEDMQKEYMKYTKEFFVNYLDEDFINVYEDMTSNFKDCQQTMMETFKPWKSPMELEKLKEVFGKGPKGYYEFLKEYNLRLLESFSVLENSKYSNYFKEQLDFQKMEIEKINDYNKLVADYYQKIFDIFKEATKKSFEEYQKDLKEGLEKNTFEDFYEFTKVKSKEYIQRAIRGEEYNKILVNTIENYKNFMESQNEMMKKFFEIFNKENDKSNNEVEKIEK